MDLPDFFAGEAMFLKPVSIRSKNSKSNSLKKQGIVHDLQPAVLEP